MSETKRQGRAEEHSADGVLVIRRYQGGPTAEELVLNLIRAHVRRT